MIITKDMVYSLLTNLNERLRADYIKESIYFASDMIQIKRIKVYDNETQITVGIENEESD